MEHSINIEYSPKKSFQTNKNILQKYNIKTYKLYRATKRIS